MISDIVSWDHLEIFLVDSSVNKSFQKCINNVKVFIFMTAISKILLRYLDSFFHCLSNNTNFILFSLKLLRSETDDFRFGEILVIPVPVEHTGPFIPLLPFEVFGD